MPPDDDARPHGSDRWEATTAPTGRPPRAAAPHGPDPAGPLAAPAGRWRVAVPGAGDIGFALAVAVVVVAGTVGAVDRAATLWPGGWALLLAGAAATAWQRRHPVPVLLATFAVMNGYHLLGYPGGLEPLPFAAALLVTTLEGHRLVAVAAAVAAAALLTLPTRSLDELPLVALALAVVLAAGEVGRARRAHRREAERRAVDAERLRIARELHDALVHHLSLINVQAGAALVRPDRSTEAIEALTAIRAASGEALREVRAVVGALRESETSRLVGLDELVRRVSSAGRSVTLRVRGAPGVLPPEVDHAAYRVVQESLTNAVRHANPTRIRVTVDHAEDGVTVRVDDNGAGGAGGTGGTGGTGESGDRVAPGHGLTGMRERVTALGGSLRVAVDGGCSVRAWLPTTAGHRPPAGEGESRPGERPGEWPDEC
ncbi:Signal transduction histidine kinase [Amycolatopsis arida]|uniref:histidine kinase n=1 Tax=Amycolatopsis arida TaxID=587909 RepID=A0A1I5M409_9PSEU|nr:sensor histidine kinase [Amycolatopsis arida]TDX93958.1 signal transduction histidine kinase [Amycolatopsis arida]SFP04223.1 Signal transduction histidine kinase [Amycolatopsis arida]